jgi:hypothetical protein
LLITTLRPGCCGPGVLSCASAGAGSHDSAHASAQARFRKTIIAFLSERFFSRPIASDRIAISRQALV